MRSIVICAAVLAAAGLFVGCETTPAPPDGLEHGPHGTIAYDVLVEASEPGARIEVNGETVGNTPVHLKIFGDKDGTFHNFGSYEYPIRALPLTTNQFPQMRIYRTGDIFMPEDQIPKQIFFDMNQRTPVYSTYPPVYYGSPGYYGPPAYYGSPYWYGPSFYFYGGHGGHGYHHNHGMN